MAEPRKKSGKRSGGKGKYQKSYRLASLYSVFDENLCGQAEILAALTEADFAFKRHLEFFSARYARSDWLPSARQERLACAYKDKASDLPCWKKLHLSTH